MKVQTIIEILILHAGAEMGGTLHVQHGQAFFALDCMKTLESSVRNNDGGYRLTFCWQACSGFGCSPVKESVCHRVFKMHKRAEAIHSSQED